MVTLNYSKLDWHGGANNSIFKREGEDFPVFDQCVSALVEDLYQRGLDRDCSVVIWGEFGRTPICVFLFEVPFPTSQSERICCGSIGTLVS